MTDITDLIYQVFVSHLETLMRIVLEVTLEATKNPLLSLAAVSFVVSLGSLPLYHLAEKWQDTERRDQQRLKPKLSEFKSVFKGQVLNAYIHTLYRQNGYHPIFAVRAMFGLLIQIPFFLAAYHLLSNYAELNGVSTVLFRDLGAPDGMIRIGNVSVNLMPFLMTAINLGSAAIYGRKLLFKEKVPLYVMAGIFLIALYNSPSALLFYWTCNNLISLIKNIVYNFIFHKGALYSLRATAPKAYPSLEWIHKRLPGWAVQAALVAMAAGAYAARHFHLLPKAYNHLLFGAALVFLLTAVVIRCFQMFVEYRRDNPILTGGYVLSCAAVLAISAAFALSSKKKTDLDMVAFIGAAVLYGMFILHSALAKVTDIVAKKSLFEPGSKGTSFFFLTLINLSLLLFLFGPLSLLSFAGKRDFEEPMVFYLSNMLMLATAFVFVLSIVYAYLQPARRAVMSYFLYALTLAALISGFVFVGDYGDMTNFVFEEKIDDGMTRQLLNIFAMVAVPGLLAALVYRRKFTLLRSFMWICLISMAVFAVDAGLSFAAIHQGDKPKAKTKLTKLGKDFVLSKKGKNVIVVMMDRLVGGYVDVSFDIHPQMKKDFDGFVWYPWMMSGGGNTVAGAPGLLGGWDYTVDALYHERRDVRFTKKFDEVIRVMPYNFARAGYKSVVYHEFETWVDKKDKRFLKNVKLIPYMDKYRQLWLKRHNMSLSYEDVNPKLAMFGLFRVSPLFARNKIYDDGKWHIDDKAEGKTIIGKDDVSFQISIKTKKNDVVNAWSSLDYMPEVSSVSKSSQDRFYFVSYMLPHCPGFTTADLELDLENRIHYSREMYDRFGKDIFALQHLYANAASLKLFAKWLRWLKKNGVYDNTRIIVVSDHGRSVHDPFFKKQRINGSKLSKMSSKPGWFHATLMVKDFNSRGPLEENDEFMATYDVPYLAMKGLFKGTNPYTGNEIKEQKNKTPFKMILTEPYIRNVMGSGYKLKDAFILQSAEDMSDPRKWKKTDVE